MLEVVPNTMPRGSNPFISDFITYPRGCCCKQAPLASDDIIILEGIDAIYYRGKDKVNIIPNFFFKVGNGL